MKTLQDGFQSGRQCWFPKKRKTKCCWFLEDTREKKLVSKVGDKVGPKSGRQGWSKGWSKTKLIFNKFLIFFLNENKEEWYRRESKSGNFILEDNYGG